MVMSSQMVFTGEAGCPEFSANPFRADICRVCQNRIQSHSGATETQITRALEFSVATVPSLVWSVEGGGQLYLGGYKAAINTTFLTTNKVSLVVNTAQGLHLVLGPKYLRSLETRRTQCPDVEVHDILMDDDLQQKLCLEDLVVVYHKVMECLGRGDSVLVHCAQGKSRSTTVVIAVMCFALKKSVEEVLLMVKQKRNMAEPNSNFLQQLKQFHSNGDFNL